MLRIPDWLFITLAIISIILFIALAVFLVWCILVKLNRKKFGRSPKKGQQLIVTPATTLLHDSSAGYLSPSYIPYTVPTIVQAPRYKSQTINYSTNDLLNPATRYHRDNYRLNDVASCHSEPVINHARYNDERFSLKFSPRHSELLARPSSQLSHKAYSPASSRASSIKSDHGDLRDIDAKASTLTSKEVYLHSSLLHHSSLDHDDFITGDHVISYDQETKQETNYLNGALFLSLYYDQEASELIITIKQATDLPISSTEEDEFEVYINFCIVPEDFYWQKTMSVPCTRFPVFNQTFTISDVLHHKLRQYTLCFLVMNRTPLKETMLGKVMVPLSDLRAGMMIDMCKELGQN